MTEEKEPRVPVVGDYVRMIGRLVAIQDVTPPPPPTREDYIFEDTAAHAEGRVNGNVVITRPEFNNFQGEGTCVGAAIEDAKEKALELGPSDMEFVVVRTTTRVRMRLLDNACIYAEDFRDAEPLGRGASRGMPKPVKKDVWTSSDEGD